MSSPAPDARPLPITDRQRPRHDSTPIPLGPKTPVPAACEPPEKPVAAAAGQAKRGGRGLLGRLLPVRGRQRSGENGIEGSTAGIEGSTAAGIEGSTVESEPAADTNQQPERRGHLSKLFHHGKDKHKKHKAKTEKKKEAEALLAA